MSNLRFASPEHRDFFLDMMSEARRMNCPKLCGQYKKTPLWQIKLNFKKQTDFVFLAESVLF